MTRCVVINITHRVMEVKRESLISSFSAPGDFRDIISCLDSDLFLNYTICAFVFVMFWLLKRSLNHYNGKK